MSARKTPSDKDILNFLEEREAPVGTREVARAFDIHGPEREALKDQLRRLDREGHLQGRVKGIGARRREEGSTDVPPVAALDIVDVDEEGDLIAVRLGKAGEQDETGATLRLRSRSDLTLGVGNRALCRLKPLGDNTFDAKVITRLDAKARRILGVVRRTRTGLRVEPVDFKARSDVEIDESGNHDLEPGDVVAMELKPGRGRGPKRGHIEEVLGKSDDPRTFSLMAAHERGIRMRFPNEALGEAEQAHTPKLDKTREDLRNLPLITIDPADARDHDDAVFAERDGDGWRIIVAIADVADYVRPFSSLDDEAGKRGVSTYLPDRVIPMLPEALSNGLCSLKASEDRACLFADMRFDKQGNKTGHRFGRGLIRIQANLSYQDAQSVDDGAPSAAAAPFAETVIEPLFQAYRVLARARDERGPLDLDMDEYKVRLDDQGFPVAIERQQRLTAHRLIEEMMIQANVAAAEALEAKGGFCVYRVHEPPSGDKLMGLIEYVNSLNLSAPKAKTWKPSDFNVLIDEAEQSDMDAALKEAVLRSQAQAVYSADNLGHFGLNLRRYAHFTSPIRRYADLLVHRSLIRAYKLGEGGLPDEQAADLDALAGEISSAERAAMAAERDAKDRFIAHYMMSEVGAEFHGRITGVTRAGLFVRLEDTGADGFVPIATLGREYWIHEERENRLVGSETGSVYRLGQPVEVRLDEAAPLAGGLRLTMLSPPELNSVDPGKPAGRKPKSKAKAKSPRSDEKGKAKRRRKRS